MHINAVGSYKPTMQEVDAETLLRSYVVVDTIEGAIEETGDLIIPLEQGIINKDAINVEIGEIVSGKKPSRTSDDQITFFKSTGIAVQDAVAANRALIRAVDEGYGVKIQI
jgi:ornithine cyclodeaminase/alanine dehydrogenase-like protein (mu-crystallin family)